MVSSRWCVSIRARRNTEPVDRNDSSSTMNTRLEINFRIIKFLVTQEQGVIMQEQGATMSRFIQGDFGAVHDELKQVLLPQFANLIGSQRFHHEVADGLIDYAKTRHITGSAKSLVIRIKKFLIYDRVERWFESIESDRLNMVPASMDAITSLPEKEMKYENDDAEVELCTVCLEEIPAGLVISTLPCSHVFHNNCIRDWLVRSHHCPICLFEISTAQ